MIFVEDIQGIQAVFLGSKSRRGRLLQELEHKNNVGNTQSVGIELGFVLGVIVDLRALFGVM